MKQSSSWSSPIDPHAPGRACKQPHVALFIFSLLCHIMTACSSPSSIPTQFDAIERISINTVLVHDQRIAYLDLGAGLPVILIHGFRGSMWQWEQQQRALSQHFRVLTLDLPGAGLSDKPEIDYRPDQMLDFFVGFMDAVKIQQATLVGKFHERRLGHRHGTGTPHTRRQARPYRRAATTCHGEAHQSVSQAGPTNQCAVLACFIRQLAARRTDDRVRLKRDRA